jgi:hypothetical protein
MIHPLLRFVCLSLVAVSLSSCEHYMHRFAGPSPAPGTRVNWPGMKFDEVRAYCYDYTAEHTPTFLNLQTGHMHSGVMDPRGVKLSKTQIGRLMDGITISQPKGSRTACYAPHHAFVFFNKGKPVAVFEMCFGCNRQVSYPSGTPEYVDRAGLYQLTGELGLPLGVGNKFYTTACTAGRVR